MAFCTSCGSPLAEGALFCSACGQRQNAAPAAPVYQPPVAEPVYEEPTGLLNENEPVSYSEETALLNETPAAPAYEEPAPVAAPVYQPPVYEQPVYQPPVYQQPAYQQAPYQPPVYQQQQYASAPAPSGASKGKSIVAMILGIGALVFSLVDFIYTIIGFIALGTWYYGDDATAGAFLLVYGIVTLGCGIPGMILGKNGGEGNTMAKLGKIFGLIGLIFGAIALTVGFICIV